jgi:hypothetical protein
MSLNAPVPSLAQTEDKKTYGDNVRMELLIAVYVERLNQKKRRIENFKKARKVNVRTKTE